MIESFSDISKLPHPRLHYLQNKKLHEPLQNHFNNYISADFVCSQISRDNITQTLVDNIYNTITAQIIYSASQILGIYSPNVTLLPVPQYLKQNSQSLHSSIRHAIDILNKKHNDSVTILPSNPKVSILDEARSTFRNIYRSRNLKYSIENQPQIMAMPCNFKFTDISKITYCVSSYPAHKSPGPDTITQPLLKVLLESNLGNNLADLFNMFAVHSIFPTQWLAFNTTLIPKKASGTFYLNDLRPIGVGNLLRTIFERLLKPFLMKQISISPSQYGFQPGKSTICNLAWLQDTQSSTIKTLFTDFKKAFDTVDLDILLQKLHSQLFHKPHLLHHPFSKLVFNAVNKLYYHTTTRIKVSGKWSRTVHRTRGTPQGAVLSPILFIIYINDLAETINSHLPLTAGASPISLFADDVAIRTTSDALIQKAFTLITEWCEKNHINLTPRKCATIGYTGSLLQYGQSYIPAVSSYKYLGIIVSKAGSNYFAHIIASFCWSKRLLNTIISNNGATKWLPFNRYIIFLTLIRSRWEYALVIIMTGLSNKERILVGNLGTGIINLATSWIFEPLDLPTSITSNLPLLRHLLTLQTFLDRADFLTGLCATKPPGLGVSDACIFQSKLRTNYLKQLYNQKLLAIPTNVLFPSPKIFFCDIFFKRRISSQILKDFQHIIFQPQSIATILRTTVLKISDIRRLVLWHLSLPPLEQCKQSTYQILRQLLIKGKLQEAANIIKEGCL
jgi:hypothetical protein